MKVFLTGGTGLIGSHLAERLRARGDEVVCLQREGSDTGFLDSLGCDVVRGDVRDEVERISAAASGCDVVVHAAALVYAGLPWETIHAVNVDGTRRVLEAASRAGVPRAVHVSSVATYGSRTGRVDESTSTSTPIPASDFYARSKREAETAARAVAEAHGLPLTIVRPSAIYGPRDRLFAPILARLARLPLIPVFGSGRTSLPVVYAGNVAHAIERVLDRPGDGGEVRIYNVSRDHPIGTRELIGGFAAGLGTRARFLPIPASIVVGGAHLIARLGGILPVARDLPVVRAAKLTTEPNPYRTERIRDELGWEPPFTHEEGIRATTRWLLDQESD